MSRWRGSTLVTSSPSIVTVPASGDSSPLISFKSVDLPDPEGPRIAVNELWAISTETSWTAWVVPYCFVRWLSEIDTQLPFSLSQHGEDAEYEDGHKGEDERVGVRAQHIKLLVPVVIDVDRQRLRAPRDVARHDEHGAKLAERARNGERDAVHNGPADR